MLSALMIAIAYFSLTQSSEVLGLDYLKARDSGAGFGYETYRYITYMFVHAGIIHLLSNMISLYYFGKNYLRKRNSFEMLFVFILGGALAGIIASYVNPILTKTTMTVGASGAIFALLGGTIEAHIRDEEENITRKLFKYAIITLVYSALGRNVDNVCHLAGFAAGFLIQWILEGFAIQEKLSKISKTRKHIEEGTKKEQLLIRLKKAD
jgi:membrane associated rhomboid family serine protease